MQCYVQSQASAQHSSQISCKEVNVFFFSQQLISYRPASTRVRKKVWILLLNTIFAGLTCTTYCVYFIKRLLSTARKCLPVSCTTIHNLQKTRTHARSHAHTHIAAVNYRLPNRKVYSHLGTIYFEKHTLARPQWGKKKNNNCPFSSQKIVQELKKAVPDDMFRG